MTESSHLRTLRVLDLLFYQRLRREGQLSREELALLFPNLPELIEIHSKAAPPPGSGGPTGHTRNAAPMEWKAGERLAVVFPALAGWRGLCCPRRVWTPL